MSKRLMYDVESKGVDFDDGDDGDDGGGHGKGVDFDGGGGHGKGVDFDDGGGHGKGVGYEYDGGVGYYYGQTHHQGVGYYYGQTLDKGVGYYPGESLDKGVGYYDGESLDKGVGYYHGESLDKGVGYYHGDDKGVEYYVGELFDKGVEYYVGELFDKGVGSYDGYAGESDYSEGDYEEVEDDISEYDPDDPRLFPNICDGYHDSIKWLIKYVSRMEPSDGHNSPPLLPFGSGPSYFEKPEYAGYGTPAQIQRGQHLDVVSLLSKAGCRRLLRVGAPLERYVRPQALKGKYVLLVCCFAPIRWLEGNASYLCQLRTLSEQLSEAQNFEMVIIPKMKKGCDTFETSFNNLLSPFQGRLFVPFENEGVRDDLCHSLDFQGPTETILVDTNHKVAQILLEEVVANRYYPPRYNKPKLKTLSSSWIMPSVMLRETQEMYLSSSLAWLLDSAYGDPKLRLHNLSSTQTTTVGQLTNKLVGVYLFYLGDKLKSFRDVYSQCREEGLEFEIVVVCFSLFISVDPIEFHHVAIGELQRLVPNMPWWVLPYNAATISTLHNLEAAWGEDAMIIVGPGRNFFIDKRGGHVIHHFGIEGYPFNREMVVRKYEQAAKAITLASLLCHGSIDYVVRGGKKVPVADLYDKVVVIYPCFELRCDNSSYRFLSKWYNEIRKDHSDFEVVLVYYAKPKSKIDEDSTGDDIDMLVRPFRSKHSKFLREHGSFFMGDNGVGCPMEGLLAESCLLFGKGGHLCALNAINRFEKYGLDGYPYTSGCGDEYVRKEIIMKLYLEYKFMRGYGGDQKPYDVVSLDRRSSRAK